MEYLRKLFNGGPQLTEQSAALIIFITAYLSATITVLVIESRFVEALTQLAVVGVTVLAFMTLLFGVSRILKRTDVIDAAWGPAFLVAAGASFVIGEQELGLNIQTLILVLVAIWSLRLAVTIGMRLLRHSEDRRYIELREKWSGSEPLNTYFRIFFVQAFLATVISIGVIHANVSVQRELGVVAYIGLAIWIIGFLFEVIGDAQLKAFLAQKKNKGKLMTKGLWKYTRHPNYFGESTMWWGVFIIALSVPLGWIAVITPVVITYLLYFVSGVPMTESSFARKPGWDRYKASVSKFFPLPPK